jgi:hypothetical protein
VIHHRFFYSNLQSLRYKIYIPLLFTALLACLSTASFAADSKLKSPDVLVLVLSGSSPYDSVSVQYTTEVSDKTAEADLKKLVEETRWQVGKYEITTDKANSPGAKPTTSISFQMPRIVDIQDGLLPIEPFIDVFKRFDNIQVNYLIMSPFEFAGLKDFENDFVKLNLKVSGNSYQYSIRVKNNDFKKAKLPLQYKSPTTSPQSQTGLTPTLRIILIIVIALLGSMSAYFMAAYICKRRKTG